jgi:hypothetical protein
MLHSVRELLLRGVKRNELRICRQWFLHSSVVPNTGPKIPTEARSCLPSVLTLGRSAECCVDLDCSCEAALSGGDETQVTLSDSSGFVSYNSVECCAMTDSTERSCEHSLPSLSTPGLLCKPGTASYRHSTSTFGTALHAALASHIGASPATFTPKLGGPIVCNALSSGGSNVEFRERGQQCRQT